MPQYKKICNSHVAIPEKPIGVVEFYGGQFFGQFPLGSYEYFLQCLYEAGYAVIAVPYEFSTNHIAVARKLLTVRDCVKKAFPELEDLTFFWIGHSLGCKLIAMLEAWTEKETNRLVLPASYKSMAEAEELAQLSGIYDQPSVLLAPVFADNDDLVPFPPISYLIDKIGLGVKPTRQEVRDEIERSDLFNLTGIVCFKDDDVAGHFSSNAEKKDVPWLIEKLSKPGRTDEFYKQELPGGHLKPNGDYCCQHVFGVQMVAGVLVVPTIQHAPRDLEPVVLTMLNKLGEGI
ncbi:protein of unknown function DUF1350 [Chloroherpeton thalassium ATCC 35110]|uniref:Uncharacterized protein n=1 Tax=Chloroherpeton thalassium (strain ATCC 35110 / GB-78) TaxID=517418 RepID=B3QZ25_CHLT3|nr:DUF1350 family protein [Chloroherpeton thalassium]ACF13718.1 protein of unknown function DUF1350 [Chloroherpeton thalassium ATCC 35110]